MSLRSKDSALGPGKVWGLEGILGSGPRKKEATRLEVVSEGTWNGSREVSQQWVRGARTLRYIQEKGREREETIIRGGLRKEC